MRAYVSRSKPRNISDLTFLGPKPRNIFDFTFLNPKPRNIYKLTFLSQPRNMYLGELMNIRFFKKNCLFCLPPRLGSLQNPAYKKCSTYITIENAAYI
jgi:hypothetical protein